MPQAHVMATSAAVARRALSIRSQSVGVRVLTLALPATLQAALLFAVFRWILDLQTNAQFLFSVMTLSLIWGSITQSVLAMTSAYVDNAPLMRGLAVPALALPIGTGLATALVFTPPLAALMLVGLANWASTYTLLLPLAILEHLLLILAVGTLSAEAYAAVRPVRPAVEAISQVGYFCSPIVYSLSQVPSGMAQTLVTLNPVTGLMELYRAALTDAPPPPGAVAWSLVVTGGLTAWAARRARYRSWDISDAV
jgi:ABC-type polysaccharide/polyol phosphate export permease